MGGGTGGGGGGGRTNRTKKNKQTGNGNLKKRGGVKTQKKCGKNTTRKGRVDGNRGGGGEGRGGGGGGKGETKTGPRRGGRRGRGTTMEKKLIFS